MLRTENWALWSPKFEAFSAVSCAVIDKLQNYWLKLLADFVQGGWDRDVKLSVHHDTFNQ